MNRTDKPLCADSVWLVVRHYDHWWHPSLLRLRAYYMLGSAYRDQGEAPAALHYYQIATERADTTHADSATCATLFRVYGQMASIYGQQGIPQEELEAWQRYSRYAFIAKDTFNYIVGKELSVGAYYRMDKNAKVISTTDTVHQLYLKYGFKEQAKRIYPTAIYVCISDGNFSRAHKYMDRFEHESGLFDEQGNITKGREAYYYSQGLYFLGVRQLDSAEYKFRKLLASEYFYEAYKGLFSIYKIQNNPDSIAKYAELYEQALLHWQEARQTESIIQSSAMYNYTRNQQIAMKKEQEARTAHLLNALLLAAILIVLLAGYMIYKRIRKQRKKKELEYQSLIREHQKIQENFCQLVTEHQNTLNEYQEKQGILTSLQSNYAALQKVIPDKIRQIEADTLHRLAEMQEKLDLQSKLINKYRQESIACEEELLSESIVSYFRDMANGVINGKLPTKKEWNQLITTYKHHLPHMYAQMNVSHLSLQELHVSILSHLDFSNKGIAYLCNTSFPVISRAKARANKKMFGEYNASSLCSNLKRCVSFTSEAFV